MNESGLLLLPSFHFLLAFGFIDLRLVILNVDIEFRDAVNYILCAVHYDNIELVRGECIRESVTE